MQHIALRDPFFLIFYFSFLFPSTMVTEVRASWLTDKDEHADQQGDEGSGAEGCGDDVGCGIAGLDGPIWITAAHMDGHSARAAQGWGSAVHHEDGQKVNVLLLPVEARPLGPNAGSIIWRLQRTLTRLSDISTPMEQCI